VAARVVAVSVTATARADMVFMHAVMVLSKVHSWGARPVNSATLAAPRPPRCDGGTAVTNMIVFTAKDCARGRTQLLRCAAGRESRHLAHRTTLTLVATMTVKTPSPPAS
jgi:hypothetical protein